MKKLKVVLAYSAVLILLTSCETLKVAHYGTHSEKIKKVTILSVMIDKINQPALPLIDAGIFNGKTNSIAEEIMVLQQEYTNEHRHILATSFENHFNCVVRYGDSLHNHPEYANLMAEFNMPGELYTGNNNFPMIAISDGDISPFVFNNENVKNYFLSETNYKPVLGKIAEKLNSDFIAIAYSFLGVQTVGMFGASGKLVLYTTLYIFNSEGVLVSKAQNISDALNVKGDDPESYALTLKKYSAILEPMMLELETKYKSKQ